MEKIIIYDTTLRDGVQAENVSFSVEDKLRIARKLDELGVDFIEGGWPGSNPRDKEFFKQLKGEKFHRARPTAFGSTRRCGKKCSSDSNIKALLKAETPTATLVGKTWDFHVTHALEASLEENLEAIYDSISYLKKRLDSVFFDAEHFFDGYRGNPDYAVKCLQAACEGGADCLCLCDTNGGTLPAEIGDITAQASARFNVKLGIHCHNDSGAAVAGAIAAVRNGARQVQGTINGIGERCGNANLCTIIPNLQLKMGYKCIPPKNMALLREASRFVYEMSNMPPYKRQPYVGDSAFAHKGGIHVSAVRKHPETYEHIEPEKVGNKRRVLVSDLSGRSNIEAKAMELGLKLNARDKETKAILGRVKALENQGYQFEGADASFELLVMDATHGRERFFELRGFRVIDEKRTGETEPYVEATIMVKVGDQVEHTASTGNGPVNALDNALRKALERFYPELADVRLIDYKVRVLPAGKGTASQVRVLIESSDGIDKWGTVGVSENIIEASYEALVDSVDYKIYKDRKKKGRKRRQSK